jgi:hypothetical protein
MSDKAELIAAAQINAFTGPPPGIEFNSNKGFETASRSSAGEYVLELEHKHSTKKLVVNVTLNTTVLGNIVATVLDEKHIQINTFLDDDGIRAADSPFFITVHRVRD